MRYFPLHTLTALIGGISLSVSEAEEASSPLPAPLNSDLFSAVTSNSPFQRSLDLPESMVLTGVARIEDDVIVTLFDTETSETHLVSRAVNTRGWQLVEVRGDHSDLETLTAKIQVAGGKVLSVRYEKTAVPGNSQKSGKGGRPGSSSGGSSRSGGDEARHAAINYKEGFSSDGYPKEPPPEIIRKLSRISVEKREAINRRMIELRQKGMGMEERRKIYNDLVDRSVNGR